MHNTFSEMENECTSRRVCVFWPADWKLARVVCADAVVVAVVRVADRRTAVVCRAGPGHTVVACWALQQPVTHFTLQTWREVKRWGWCYSYELVKNRWLNLNLRTHNHLTEKLREMYQMEQKTYSLSLQKDVFLLKGRVLPSLYEDSEVIWTLTHPLNQKCVSLLLLRPSDLCLYKHVHITFPFIFIIYYTFPNAYQCCILHTLVNPSRKSLFLCFFFSFFYFQMFFWKMRKINKQQAKLGIRLFKCGNCNETYIYIKKDWNQKQKQNVL